MRLKQVTLEDVSRIANALISKHGKTTSLDVKNKLRIEGFFAQQKTVSTMLKQVALTEKISTIFEAGHLVYEHGQSVASSTSAVASSPQTVVLVTVNDNETHAVLDAFLGPNVAPKQRQIGGITYNLLGQHGGHEVVHTICEMGAGGLGASQQRTHEAIEHWKPIAIIAVGIAFGMDEDKQKIGEVLVATQVANYELSRINADGTITLRADKPACSDTLLNRFRQADTLGKRSFSTWPKLRFGPVLSGQKLVDNLDYRTSLKQLYTEAIGGEMEATGLYVSASGAKVDWIVIKAICDWGHSKNNPNKDRWQNIAANNAAWILRAALDSTSLKNCEPNFQSDSIQNISTMTATNLVNTAWPPNTPQQLVREVEALKIDGELRSRVIDVLMNPEFPSLMSLNGSLVANPVWDCNEADRVRESYWPTGARLPIIARADIMLIRRNNRKHEGELLTYPSKWGTHLIHFRPWKPEQKLDNRDALNRVKFAAQWGVPPESIEVKPTGKSSVSAKINEEYKDLWIYVFEYFSVQCKQWSEEQQQIHENGFTVGIPEVERNRWRHLQEMRTDPVASKVNGDVLRALHQFFDVNLTSLSNSFILADTINAY